MRLILCLALCLASACITRTVAPPTMPIVVAPPRALVDEYVEMYLMRLDGTLKCRHWETVPASPGATVIESRMCTSPNLIVYCAAGGGKTPGCSVVGDFTPKPQPAPPAPVHLDPEPGAPGSSSSPVTTKPAVKTSTKK